MNNLDNPDLQFITAEARQLALNYKHGFISLEHCLVATLTTPCLAQKYLSALDVTECLKWLSEQHPGTSNLTRNDSVPLTLHMERIVKHAQHLALQQNTHQITSIHILMGMLSYENVVSKKVKKIGVLFEDISNGLSLQPLEIQLRHFHKPSPVASFFRLAPSKKKLQEEIYDHASTLYTYQQYDECIAVCNNGLHIYPDLHKLKLLLSYSSYNKRDYSSAIRYLEEMIELQPDDSYWVNLALFYSQKGDHQQADNILDQLLAQQSDKDGLLNNNKGFNLYRQGRYAEAVPYYERAIQNNPSFAYPYDNLGFVKHKLGQTTEAFTLIDKSLELDKGNSYAYMFKGRIYLDQDNKALALEQFQLALRYGFTKTYGEEVLQLIKQCQ
ncbi:MAG: tetratricopeptide repeat protein [Niastella sp.]|nr:tetratricopeptide repeat protein [Niastella sp.]